jgi:hypothetical protein
MSNQRRCVTHPLTEVVAAYQTRFKVDQPRHATGVNECSRAERGGLNDRTEASFDRRSGALRTSDDPGIADA